MSIARVVCVAGMLAIAGAASAQSTITLFGQEYSVLRINYSDAIRVPRNIPNLPLVPFIESEGIQYVGGNKVLLSADDVNDAGGPTNENWIVEAQLAEHDCQITGIESFRVVLTQLVSATGYDLNPTGVTFNASEVGFGAGGNAIVAFGDGKLFGFTAAPGASGTQLDFPIGAGCPGAAFDCAIDISSRNNNLEDVVFAPLGSNGVFFTINQDQPTVERWDATTGQFISEFFIGFALPNPPSLFDAKGVTYSPDSEFLPAAIRDPDGVVLVAFDNGYPGLQAFDVNGNFLGTEVLTVNGLPSGTARLDVDGCPEQLHLESLTIDPATGRLFLSNQGSLTLCNYLWVLTPTSYACSSCPVCAADYDDNGGVDGGDLGAFFADFEAGETCADVDQNGGVDGGDLGFFFQVFEAGGC